MGYYVHCGDLDVRLGNFASAQASFERALELSLKIGLQNDEAMILADLAQVLIPLGEYERAKAVCQQSIERNRKFYNRWGNAYGLLLLGNALLGLGEDEAAEQCFAEGIRICEENRIQNMHVSLLCQQALLLARQGRLDTAHVRLREALERVVKVQIPPLIIDVLTGLATICALQGDQKRAVLTATCISRDPAATYEARQEATALLRKIGELPNDTLPAMDTQAVVQLFLSTPPTDLVQP
jgi:tetratricopeptide (TPR) repeat protein